MSNLILGGRRSRNGAIFDGPDFGIAFPAFQVFAIEQGDRLGEVRRNERQNTKKLRTTSEEVHLKCLSGVIER